MELNPALWLRIGLVKVGEESGISEGLQAGGVVRHDVLGPRDVGDL